MKTAGQTRQPEARIDVDALALAVEHLDGKLPPEDIAYLRALTGLVAEVRSSDASMERVRRLLRGVRVTR